MRYFVRGELIDPGSLTTPKQKGEMLSEAVVPSLKAIVQMEKDGKVLASGTLTGQRAGVLIVEAESNEKVTELLMSLPFWPLLKWEVIPLDSFAFRAETEGQAAERLKNM